MKTKLTAALLTILLLSQPVSALIPDEFTETEINASWGSTLRDYLSNEDGNLVQTRQNINNLKLKVDYKDGPIKSVSLVSLSKGPNGETPVYSGDKFVAVEIVLDTPAKPINDTFEVGYTVTVKRNIEDGDDERQLTDGTTLEGRWLGTGRYVAKTVSSSMNLTETGDIVAFDSSDYDIKTVIKFANTAIFAVDWSSREPSKYMNFSTSTTDVEIPQEFNTSGLVYINFKGSPTFIQKGRLVLKGSENLYLFQKDSKQWVHATDYWYDSKLKGYVLDTDKLGEFLLTSHNPNPVAQPIQTQEEPKQDNTVIIKTETEETKTNPYLERWKTQVSENPTQSEIESEQAIEPEREQEKETVDEDENTPISDNIEPAKEEKPQGGFLSWLLNLFT